jgi:hypothetical protein
MKKPFCPPYHDRILAATASSMRQCRINEDAQDIPETKEEWFKSARLNMPEKTVEENDPRLSFTPLEVAVIPPTGLIEHIKDKWWIVHPTKGVCYFRKHSPQCNSNEEVGRRFMVMYPWAELKFIPSVFRTIEPRDYV